MLEIQLDKEVSLDRQGFKDFSSWSLALGMVEYEARTQGQAVSMLEVQLHVVEDESGIQSFVRCSSPASGMIQQ